MRTETDKALSEAVAYCNQAENIVTISTDCPSVKDAIIEQLKLAKQMLRSAIWVYNLRAQIETRYEESGLKDWEK
jgi:hypothetical protein